MSNLFLIIIIVSMTLSLSAQNGKDYLIHRDSLQEIYAVDHIDAENFSSLLVCLDGLTCKGFITEKDTSNTTEIDVRAVISRISSYKFKIEYKYRNSVDFISDTFNIFCLNGSSSIAFPYAQIDNDFTSDLHKWSFIPASSDERDVVYIKTEDEKIVIYQKK